MIQLRFYARSVLPRRPLAVNDRMTHITMPSLITNSMKGTLPWTCVIVRRTGYESTSKVTECVTAWAIFLRGGDVTSMQRTSTTTGIGVGEIGDGVKLG
jgi:hypothetical protein